MNQLVSALSQLSLDLVSLPCRVLAYREFVPSGLCGSYVSLSGGGAEHIVGILSHPVGWEALGSALDRELPRSERRGIVEGACELTKIVAELFQRRALDGVQTIMGLPLFVDSPVSSGRQIELQAVDVALGNATALVVLFSRSRALPSSLPVLESA